VKVFILNYHVGMRASPILVYSVPWDVTVTYRSGSHLSPGFIQESMAQLDDQHPFSKDAVELSFLPANSTIVGLQHEYKDVSSSIIDALNHQHPLTTQQHQQLADINRASDKVNQLVLKDMDHHRNSPVILCGGEHGVGVGYIALFANQVESFSILQIDAHMDCRVQYFGYDYSHASVMTHYANHRAVSGITQVGIRDYASVETQFQAQSDTPFHVFTDYGLHQQLFQGKSWHDVCQQILGTLSDRVFISLDVDGLMAYLCPKTGTPVPGGLSYNQLVYLLEQVSKTRHVIGAELVEVNASSASDWNADVGARLLFLLAGCVSF
jgi:agmatinase